MNKTNGKIYKIINTKDDYIYIGSTITKLSSRMYQHRKNANNIKKTSKFYNHMRNIGVEYFKIILIKNYECNSREELEAEEYKTMENFNKLFLLNENTVYKRHSEEHSRKVGESQKGEKSHKWKFGSVLKRVYSSVDGYTCDAWCYRYILNGKYKEFSFSINKYGEDVAKTKAEQKRIEIFPNAI